MKSDIPALTEKITNNIKNKLNTKILHEYNFFIFKMLHFLSPNDFHINFNNKD